MQIADGKVYTIYGEKYVFTQKYLELMRKNKIEMKHIRSRVHNKWTLQEAVSIPYQMSRLEYRELQEIKRIEEKEKKQKKYKKSKPWLELYPQKTEFGKYAQQLFNECCGSW